jgi:hypothetical protein
MIKVKTPVAVMSKKKVKNKRKVKKKNDFKNKKALEFYAKDFVNELNEED